MSGDMCGCDCVKCGGRRVGRHAFHVCVAPVCAVVALLCLREIHRFDIILSKRNATPRTLAMSCLDVGLDTLFAEEMKTFGDDDGFVTIGTYLAFETSLTTTHMGRGGRERGHTHRRQDETGCDDARRIGTGVRDM